MTRIPLRHDKLLSDESDPADNDNSFLPLLSAEKQCNIETA